MRPGRSCPVGWVETTVGKIASTIQYGFTASAVDRKEGPRLLRITDIQKGRVDWSAVPSCEIGPKDFGKYELSCGDIVFARTGATTGKSFLIGDCPDAVFASYLIRLQVPSANPAFLYYFFQTNDYWRQIETEKRGVGQPNVNSKILAALSAPFAPLPEQHRIVAKIEELFSELDAGVAALERARAKLERYRASVLKAAVEGKLTEPWRAENPPEETGEELLERILVERRKRWEEEQLAKFAAKGKKPPTNWREKYKEPVGADVAELPELPEGWCWATMEQLASSLSNGRSVRTKQGGFPVLRLTAITGWALDLSARKCGDWDREAARPVLVKQGDFFVSRGNGSLHLVGRAAFVPDMKGEVAFPDTMIRVRRSSDLVRVQYLAAVWNSRIVRRQVESSAKTTAGIYKVNQDDLNRINLPLPPPREQDELVEELTESSQALDIILTGMTRDLQRATALRQSILKRAFEGRLVPQDPNDEPASILLERIRAEREATQKARKPKKSRRTTKTKAKPETPNT